MAGTGADVLPKRAKHDVRYERSRTGDSDSDLEGSKRKCTSDQSKTRKGGLVQQRKSTPTYSTNCLEQQRKSIPCPFHSMPVKTN
jgi:hypothetical protein